MLMSGTQKENAFQHANGLGFWFWVYGFSILFRVKEKCFWIEEGVRFQKDSFLGGNLIE